ncbi:MAG: CotH kinase family protein, partial [Oscillospiraceae bacterium]|nr:CotH kinase family protein [Oscillospiraceae bacterium]
MKHIKITGMYICAFVCLVLCGCNATFETPADDESSSSVSESVSDGLQSSLIQASSSGDVEPSNPIISEPPETSESSAPQESFCGNIIKAEVSSENRLLNGSRPFTVDNENGKITLDVTYGSYVDIKTLQNCIVDIEVESGQYQFGGAVNGNGNLDLTKKVTLAVTDKNGLARDYSVEVNRMVCDLPIVNLYLANGAGISSVDRDIYSDMSLYIDSSGAEGFESTDFLSGGIHGRGHSTWKWQKKPYRIKLNEKAGLLGLPKNKDWILLANYSDKSLVRNIVAYDMGRELDSFVWTPTQYSVDLFVNGEYRGVYALGEQREIAKSKINLTEDPADPDRGYLIEIGGADGEELVNGIDKFHVKSGCADNCTFVDPKPK